jgi:hypothetical protein
MESRVHAKVGLLRSASASGDVQVHQREWSRMASTRGIGQGCARGLFWAVLFCILSTGSRAGAQVSEDRTPTGGAGMTTRKCVGGSNAGAECTSDAACVSGVCFD